jgi:hypothetical protein
MAFVSDHHRSRRPRDQCDWMGRWRVSEDHYAGGIDQNELLLAPRVEQPERVRSQHAARDFDRGERCLSRDFSARYSNLGDDLVETKVRVGGPGIRLARSPTEPQRTERQFSLIPQMSSGTLIADFVESFCHALRDDLHLDSPCGLQVDAHLLKNEAVVGQRA